MKSYPTIPKTTPKTIQDQEIFAFDKLDGSNIRAEWSPKEGFHKFGSRKKMLHEDALLYKARELILSIYGEILPSVFRERKHKKAVCFFEFYGPHSFAGQHEIEDNHTVTLFDLAVDNRGFCSPQTFLEYTKGIPAATLLYQGMPTEEFINQVRTGTLDGMTYEGVICKGKNISPGLPLMFKVKNEKWIQALKDKYAGNESLIQELL
jgi:hypothetical protein